MAQHGMATAIDLKWQFQEKARQETAKKKAEAKKLAEEEDAQMAAKAKKTPSKASSSPKVMAGLSLMQPLV